MNLRLARIDLAPGRTVGQLYVNDRYECWTLEDEVRAPGVKVKGATAIPAGRYRVVRDWSNRFKRYMLHLLDVPMFDGIRIHAGNDAGDTEGCVLVGCDRVGPVIHRSQVALIALESKVNPALAAGEECWIEVVNGEGEKA